MNNKNAITTQPIPGLIKAIALPASIGFFFNTMYNVVDTYYSGLISTQAIASLALSFPVFFIIIAFGSGLATGVTALIANALGSDNVSKARVYVCQALTFVIILAVLLSLVGLLAAPRLFKIMGADNEYLAMSLSYVNVIFYGTVFFLLTFTLNSALVARGDTKTFRNALIVGFFLNLLLDPWLMFGGLGLPALGLAGVAWATVFIQFLVSIYIFYKVLKKGLFSRACLPLLKPRRQYFLEIAYQGFPASFNSMTIAIGVFIITYFINFFGKEIVAAYGIGTRIDQIFLLPSIGINMATLTLVGQNNGAGRHDRVKETIKKTMIYGLFISTLGAIIVLLLARQLVAIFSSDPAVVKAAVGYLRISVFVYWAYTLLFIMTSALQGLKKPLYVIWLGLSRQMIVALPLFFLMARVFNLGVKGIWLGILIVNWLAVLATMIYLRSVLKRVTVIGNS